MIAWVKLCKCDFVHSPFVVKRFAAGLAIVCLRFVLIGYVANPLKMNLSRKNMPFIGTFLA